MTEPQILLLSDRSHFCRGIDWVLKNKGYRVRMAYSPEAAIKTLVTRKVDLIIYMFTKEGLGGIEVIKIGKKFNPKAKVILISLNYKGVFPFEAYQIEVDDYLVIPCSCAELFRRISGCLETLNTRCAENPTTAHLNKVVLEKLIITFHDIQGSMLSIAAIVKLLNRGTYGELDAKVTEKLHEVYSRIGKVIGITEKLMSKVLSGDHNKEIRTRLSLRDDIVERIG